jgi:hypothetical protein
VGREPPQQAAEKAISLATKVRHSSSHVGLLPILNT